MEGEEKIKGVKEKKEGKTSVPFAESRPPPSPSVLASGHIRTSLLLSPSLPSTPAPPRTSSVPTYTCQISFSPGPSVRLPRFFIVTRRMDGGSCRAASTAFMAAFPEFHSETLDANRIFLL